MKFFFIPIKLKNKFDGIKGKKYLFIDEVQEIKAWEKAVNSFLTEELADIIITGSNARLFSSQLATLLSGRFIEIPVYLLCFKEFLEFRKVDPHSSATETEFYNYLKYGGLPGIHHFDVLDDSVNQYLESIFNTVLLKDIVSRNNIRDIQQLESIIRFVFDNCGSIVSSKRIADFLKNQKTSTTVDTVQNYLRYLQNAFIVYKVSRYDVKGLRHLEYLEKIYMSDIGLRHGFIVYKEKDISGLLENIVFLELLHRGYKIHIGKLNDKEIDFIALKDDNKIYFQVSYLLADKNVADREFGPLREIKDNYRKIVLSLDKYYPANTEGIEWMNLIEFLVT